jgi:glycosyltransferase involved in cell wall biosynthesis
MKKLTICIPTYNREHSLSRCLNALSSCERIDEVKILISDNGSNYDVKSLIGIFEDKLDITLNVFSTNKGRVINYLKVVEMADKIEFCWLLGDDDILLSDGLSLVLDKIDEHPEINFIYTNSYSMTQSDFEKYRFSQLRNQKTFSISRYVGKRSFLSLLSPSVSFDFLGAMFLCVFRTECWSRNIGSLNKPAVSDQREFSYYDNTFPHVRIFLEAFSGGDCYHLGSPPVTVNLSGVREWGSLSPLINIVWIPETLNIARSKGLGWMQWYLSLNYLYRLFWPEYIKLIIRKQSGSEFVSVGKLFFMALVVPVAYVSPLIYLFTKFKTE